MMNIEPAPQKAIALDPYSFEYMLGAITPEVFFRDYYQKRPCKIVRNSPTYYHHLLTLDKINEVMSSQTLRFPKTKLVNSALDEMPKADAFTTNGTDIHPARFLKHYTEGCTMVFSSLHERVTELGLFCDHMHKYFSHGFQTNIYLTPPNAQGFNPHYDTHDVFILQVAGSKLWRLFNTPIELPLKSQPFELKKMKPGDISDEFVLHAGDMLYIPRGLMHDAETTGELSMHITAGLLGYTWQDLLVETVLNLAATNIELRKNLPIGFARGTQQQDQQANATIAQILRDAANEVDARASFDRFTEKLQSDLLPNLPDQFAQIQRLGDIGPDSLVQRRPETWYRRTNTDSKCTIHIYGQNIEFPDFTGPAIDFIDRTTPFAINELPDCMDTKGKVVFVKRLIKEGILVMI